METLMFDPADKAGKISLEQLDRTLKFEDAGGKLPASAPIHHADLIKQIIGIAGDNAPAYEALLAPMTIKQANCRRIAFKGPAEECPLENYSVDRLVAKIAFKGSGQFKDDPDAKGVMCVGLSYNERGIQVAFGHNVTICQNLNVFGQHVFTSYGNGKTPFDKGIQLITHWMQNFDQVRDLNRQKIEFLKSIEVSEDKRLRVFGKIYEHAIRANEGDKTIDAPLNVTECNRMVAAGFSRILDNGPVNAWDITNWATSVLKPESSDMVNIMLKNARLNDFLLEEFALN